MEKWEGVIVVLKDGQGICTYVTHKRYLINFVLIEYSN